MSAWRRLSVPPFCERLIGFSVPQDSEVLVISYEAVHSLHLGSEIVVETDDQFAEYDIYDPDVGLAHYRGKAFEIIGLHGGRPLLQGLDGERLVLDSALETLSVVRDGKTAFSMRYDNSSGDWAAATFSPDGEYIVLGCPYDFDFVVLERASPPPNACMV